MNYSNSKMCSLSLHSVNKLKRQCSRDCMPDQRIKVSRHSFSSRMNGLQCLQHQASSGIRNNDFSQLMEFGDSDTSQIALPDLCNDAYSLTIKNTMTPEPLDSTWLIPPLSDRVSEFGKHNCAVLYNGKSSTDVNLTHTAVIAMTQKSQQGCEQLGASRTFPTGQSFHNSSPASNDHGCPKCAAGQSGHIQHIGQWRVMDSI